MKRKKMKQKAALILAMIMIFSIIVACGNNGATPEATPDAGTTDTTDADQEATEIGGGGDAPVDDLCYTWSGPASEADKFARYDPPITLTHVRGIASAHNVFPEGDDLTNNAFTRLIYEELGIIIEYLWYVDSVQYATRAATMMASGDFPDFWLADNRDFMNLARNEAVLDITELYQMWASEALRAIDATFEEGFYSAFVDGRQFGIAELGHGIMAVPEVIWVRSDWLEASGMDEPRTLDELTELALVFMEMIPDSHGFALQGSMDGGVMGLTAIANGFNAVHRMWFEQDGEIIYGSIQPEMRNTLEYLQDWFDRGIIHPEFSAHDGGTVMEHITSGRVGIMSGACWAGWWPLVDSVTADNAYWHAIQLPSQDGERSNLQVGWQIWQYYVINRDSAHPEAVIKLMNFFIAQEDEHSFNPIYRPEFEGLMLQAQPIIQTRPNRTYEQHIHIFPALTSGDPSAFADDNYLMYRWEHGMRWVRERDPASFGEFAMYGALEVIRHYIYEDRIVMSAIRGANPDFYETMVSSLRQLEDETFIRIIQGAPITEFDSFVDAWLAMGGLQAGEEINVEFGR